MISVQIQKSFSGSIYILELKGLKKNCGKKIQKEYLLEFSLWWRALIVETRYWFCLDYQVLSELLDSCFLLFLETLQWVVRRKGEYFKKTSWYVQQAHKRKNRPTCSCTHMQNGT
jgi:hypothetical protein